MRCLVHQRIAVRGWLIYFTSHYSSPSCENSPLTMHSYAEFKELRKQWRQAKKEAEEEQREHERAERLRRDEEARAMSLSFAHGSGIPLGVNTNMVGQGMPMSVGPGMPGMRGEIMNVVEMVDGGMGPPGSMVPGSISGSMGGLNMHHPSLGMTTGAMGMGIGMQQNMANAVYAAYPRAPNAAGDYPYLHHASHPPSLHPHAQAQAQIEGRHRGSMDRTYDRFEPRGSFDQGHRVGSYDASAQSHYEMAMHAGALRRRASQPYPSPHSLPAHSPRNPFPLGMPQSPHSVYSNHSRGSVSYSNDEYTPQQQQESPVDDRFAEEEYYRQQQQQHQQQAPQPRGWELPPPVTDAHHAHVQQQQQQQQQAQMQQHSVPLTASLSASSLDSSQPDEPLLTSHVQLGQNRLPPDSTLLTPLPGFQRRDEDDEQWEEDDDRKRAWRRDGRERGVERDERRAYDEQEDDARGGV